MNTTELASMLFPFDPDTDRVIFYGTTIAYSVTAVYNIILISCRLAKRCLKPHFTREALTKQQWKCHFRNLHLCVLKKLQHFLRKDMRLE